MSPHEFTLIWVRPSNILLNKLVRTFIYKNYTFIYLVCVFLCMFSKFKEIFDSKFSYSLRRVQSVKC